MRLGNAQDLFTGNVAMRAADEALGALAGRVAQAELEWVESQPLGQLVDDAFHGIGALGGAGGAIGTNLGLVDHHIMTLYLAGGDIIGSQHAIGGRPHRGAGVGPRLKVQLGLDRREPPIAARARLDSHQRARSGAAAQKHLGA